MAPHPVLLATNLFSGQTQLGLIVLKSPSKSQGEFVDKYFSFKCGVICLFYVELLFKINLAHDKSTDETLLPINH